MKPGDGASLTLVANGPAQAMRCAPSQAKADAKQTGIMTPPWLSQKEEHSPSRNWRDLPGRALWTDSGLVADAEWDTHSEAEARWAENNHLAVVALSLPPLWTSHSDGPSCAPDTQHGLSQAGNWSVLPGDTSRSDEEDEASGASSQQRRSLERLTFHPVTPGPPAVRQTLFPELWPPWREKGSVGGGSRKELWRGGPLDRLMGRWLRCSQKAPLPGQLGAAAKCHQWWPGLVGPLRVVSCLDGPFLDHDHNAGDHGGGVHAPPLEQAPHTPSCQLCCRTFWNAAGLSPCLPTRLPLP